MIAWGNGNGNLQGRIKRRDQYRSRGSRLQRIIRFFLVLSRPASKQAFPLIAFASEWRIIHIQEQEQLERKTGQKSSLLIE